MSVRWALRKVDALRPIGEIKRKFSAEGVRYSSGVGQLLRHLPDENLDSLFNLLVAIRNYRRDTAHYENPGFVLEELLPLKDIVGVDWSQFHASQKALSAFIRDGFRSGTDRLIIDEVPRLSSRLRGI